MSKEAKFISELTRQFHLINILLHYYFHFYTLINDFTNFSPFNLNFNFLNFSNNGVLGFWGNGEFADPALCDPKNKDTPC